MMTCVLTRSFGLSVRRVVHFVTGDFTTQLDGLDEVALADQPSPQTTLLRVFTAIDILLVTVLSEGVLTSPIGRTLGFERTPMWLEDLRLQCVKGVEDIRVEEAEVEMAGWDKMRIDLLSRSCRLHESLLRAITYAQEYLENPSDALLARFGDTIGTSVALPNMSFSYTTFPECLLEAIEVLLTTRDPEDGFRPNPPAFAANVDT